MYLKSVIHIDNVNWLINGFKLIELHLFEIWEGITSIIRVRRVLLFQCAYFIARSGIALKIQVFLNPPSTYREVTFHIPSNSLFINTLSTIITLNITRAAEKGWKVTELTNNKGILILILVPTPVSKSNYTHFNCTLNQIL